METPTTLNEAIAGFEYGISETGSYAADDTQANRVLALLRTGDVEDAQALLNLHLQYHDAATSRMAICHSWRLDDGSIIRFSNYGNVFWTSLTG